MSAISEKYAEVKKTHPWIGTPVTGESQCPDGVGWFQHYAGGASIYYTPATGAHLIYGLIRQKWASMGWEKGPNGYPTTDEEDAASGKGRFNNFQQGTILWRAGSPEAFSVYGEIYNKWGETGYDTGPLGFAINDETGTAGEPCRFSEFEGGAIYWHPDLGTHIVRSPVLEAWTNRGRETGALGYPVADTPLQRGLGGILSQDFQHGTIRCRVSRSRSLVSAGLHTRLEPITRSAVVLDQRNASDNRVLPIMETDRHLRFNFALVVFRESYTASFSTSRVSEVQEAYDRAVRELDDATFGAARAHYTAYNVPSPLTKSDFVDYGGDGDPSTFQAEFAAYDKVAAMFQSHGDSAADYDIVSIVVPWADSSTDKRSGRAWFNLVNPWRLGALGTWSTIYNVTETDLHWAVFLHEFFHCFDMMLSKRNYPHLRNPDDAFWMETYPPLTSSTISPPPANLGDFSEYLLYAMLSRIKEHWADLPVSPLSFPFPIPLVPSWGTMVQEAAAGDRGNLLYYEVPEPNVLVERSERVTYQMG